MEALALAIPQDATLVRQINRHPQNLSTIFQKSLSAPVSLEGNCPICPLGISQTSYQEVVTIILVSCAPVTRLGEFPHDSTRWLAEITSADPRDIPEMPYWLRMIRQPELTGPDGDFAEVKTI